MPREPSTPRLGDSTETPNYMLAPRTNEQRNPNIKELVFWDQENPRCVVNLLTEKVKAKALTLPPHLLSLTAKQLEQSFDPNEIDRQLRLAFWDEYFLTQDNSRPKMRMEAIYGRICSREWFYQIVDTDIRFAWILKPPPEYMYQMRSLLEIGLERIGELLKLPFKEQRFHPKSHEKYEVLNTKVIAEVIKAVAILDNRVRGAVPQHIKIQAEQKNLHLHANAGSGTPYQEPKTYQEIVKQLADVQREINKINAPTNAQLIAGTENITDDREFITVAASRAEDEGA